jgi:predicted ATPase/DNA-binding winged helix-turn-helix (wHTH) protein
MVVKEGSDTENSLSFGPFRLFAAKRLVEKKGVPLHIGDRALDILIVLTEHTGEIVSKRDLIARVWPNVTVDEGSLRFHIATLRKALGEGEAGARYITNVPGRGYCFVAPISHAKPPESITSKRPVTVRPHNLPARLMRMVGRGDTIRKISDQLASDRFVTIVGAGGIGKTTVAVSVAHALFAEFDDGIRFVDLGTLSDPRLVASTLASSVGLSVNSEDPTPGLVSFLRDKHMLLVLDSCEHMVVAVATLSERIFLEAPRVHILATSREALRVEGETVHRLFPLDYPPDDAALTAAEALDFPAVQLFAERVAARANHASLSDQDARIVAEICRKLDGIALAIELAAGRVAAYGIRGTAALLEDRFGLLGQGRRTAAARHQTLNATFDWSYRLLGEYERLTFRRLSVFVGPFTFEAARSIAAADDLDEAQIVEAIGSLVDKSLLTSGRGSATPPYRLLDTTRAYAMGKLTESDELPAVARRHARYYQTYLEAATAERRIKPVAEWLTTYGSCLENVRAALNWSFSPDGDQAIGVALVVAATPLWLALSLFNECCSRADQALEAPRDATDDGKRREMQLLATLGAALQGMSTTRTKSTYTRLLKLAETLNDIDYQLRALWGLWVSSRLNHHDTLAYAKRFCDVAANSAAPADKLIGDRILGTSLHWHGNHTQARLHIERVLNSEYVTDRRSQTIRFQFDQPIAARTFLARILWLQGFPEQAMTSAEHCIEDAQSLGQVLSLCHTAMNAACQISLHTGNLLATEHFAQSLLAHSAREGMRIWNFAGHAFMAILLAERGDLDAGLPSIKAIIDELRKAKEDVLATLLLGKLAEGFGQTAHFIAGLAPVDEALARCEHSDLWYKPELLRIKGELILRQGALESAERIFESSLDLASRQGALWWELRTATSLATLRRDQGRLPEALDLLEPVYGRFTEGFETVHLVAARHLLDELA